MKKLFVIMMLVLMTTIMSGCSSVKAEEKEKNETMHVHGVELQRDGYEINGVFCPHVEVLHLYSDESDEEVKVQTAKEYCLEHGYFDVAYDPSTLRLVELRVTEDGGLFWSTLQLQPINWTTEWKG